MQCWPRDTGIACLCILLLFTGNRFARVLVADAQVLAHAASDQLDDYWDEDTQDSQPQPGPVADAVKSAVNPAAASANLSPAPSLNTTRPIQQNLLLAALKSARPLREGLVLACLAFFIFNIFRGRKTNKLFATRWAKCFCDQGGVFDRNFAQLGKHLTQPRASWPFLEDWNVVPVRGYRPCSSVVLRGSIGCPDQQVFD